jgi:tetratricopeptide (TPR) repeat protein
MISTAEPINREQQSREAIDDFLVRGDFTQAEGLIRNLIDSGDGDPSLYNALATIQASQGNYTEAEKLLKQTITRDSQFADAHYNLGLVYCRLDRQSDAIESFLNAIKANPKDPAAHNDLGAIYYSQGKTLLAKGHFIKALEANPLFKNALLNLVDICWESGAYTEALTWIKKIMESASNNSEVQEVVKDLGIREKAENKVPADPTFVPSPPKNGQKLLLKRKSEAEATDLFMKHIPEDLRHKKTGLNIAIVADFNIAGQLSLLSRLINKYTIHKSRLIVLQGDYLSYDKDLILSNGKREDYLEARNIINNADFYHIGRFPVNFGDIDWSKILHKDNSVVQYYGSEIRWNAEPIYRWHERNNIIGISCWDYTMIQNAPLFYHVNIMCDLERIRPCKQPGDIIRICHPPTNRAFKKTELFFSAMEELKGRYPVEVELIEGKSNDECLDIKARCHITYDQISVGIYGLSAIESMAAGHAVLCGISNFASSYHPDNPIIYTHENNLKDKIEFLLQNKDEIVKAGEAGRAWAKHHHDSRKIIRQIGWLYDLAIHGHRLVESRDEFML